MHSSTTVEHGLPCRLFLIHQVEHGLPCSGFEYYGTIGAAQAEEAANCPPGTVNCPSGATFGSGEIGSTIIPFKTTPPPICGCYQVEDRTDFPLSYAVNYDEARGTTTTSTTTAGSSGECPVVSRAGVVKTQCYMRFNIFERTGFNIFSESVFPLCAAWCIFPIAIH